MDQNTLKLKLKSGELSGIYILAGEEDYLIRYYLRAIRQAVAPDEAFAVFNNPTFDGEDIDFDEIIEAVKSPPMMSDTKLVEWRHANLSSLKEGEITAFEELVTLMADYPYATVVITAGDTLDFGTAKRPSAFVKRFDGKIGILHFEKSTEKQLYAWLKKHFESLGVGVTLDTVRELVFRSGKSLDVLIGEVEKLSALALSRSRTLVTPEDVNEVASATPECEAFALSNAILERNKQKAYDALHEMKIRRVDPNMAMGMVARAFDDLCAVAHLSEDGLGAEGICEILSMNEYKLKIYLNAAKRYGAGSLSEIVNELAKADASSKYGGVSGYTAVELFISRYL